MVKWVYDVGSEKPSATSRTDTLETATHQTNGFFSPQSDELEAWTPEVTPSMGPKESTNLLEAHSSNIVLTIFDCKCRRATRQENHGRTATFDQEESSQSTTLRVDICEPDGSKT